MSSRIASRLALAALAVCAAGAASAQTAPAYVNQASSPVYQGSAGTNAVMILRYDNNAKLPLNVTNLRIADVNGNDITAALYNCGNILKSGDSFVGHQLTPGEDCFLTANFTGVSVTGMATLSDSSGKTANINAYVRTMLEIRDASGNVLTHVEVR